MRAGPRSPPTSMGEGRDRFGYALGSMTRMLLPVLFLAACASKRERMPATVEEPGTIVAEADLRVGRAVEATSPPALLLELKPSGSMPARLASDLGAGREWLRVERPRGLSFAGPDLLKGEAPFRPTTASLLFVQPREGAATLAEPALLRLGGRIEAASLASRIETIPEPSDGDEDELAKVESVNLRVLLGHGLDVLLVAVGSGDLDTHHWIRVVDAMGKPADWQSALRQASAARSLDALGPYRVLVRRRHPGDTVPTHYRVRLDDVVVAAQARLVREKDVYAWVWEGVWSAGLSAQAPVGPAAWPDDAPPLEVRYKEYVRPPGNTTGSFWRGLLSPLALGADVGMAFLEGDGPLIDSVAERQRERN